MEVLTISFPRFTWYWFKVRPVRSHPVNLQMLRIGPPMLRGKEEEKGSSEIRFSAGIKDSVV